MVPALRHGDRVLVRHGAQIRAGDVVLARFRTMPERLVLKRAVRPQDGGWWLASENSFAGGDSEVHGVADVIAKVSWVFGPGTRVPRRVRRQVGPWCN